MHASSGSVHFTFSSLCKGSVKPCGLLEHSEALLAFSCLF